jgi:hypothetical protein
MTEEADSLRSKNSQALRMTQGAKRKRAEAGGIKDDDGRRVPFDELETHDTS